MSCSALINDYTGHTCLEEDTESKKSQKNLQLSFSFHLKYTQINLTRTHLFNNNLLFK
jgi:hypothetical protein